MESRYNDLRFRARENLSPDQAREKAMLYQLASRSLMSALKSSNPDMRISSQDEATVLAGKLLIHLFDIQVFDTEKLQRELSRHNVSMPDYKQTFTTTGAPRTILSFPMRTFHSSEEHESYHHSGDSSDDGGSDDGCSVCMLIFVAILFFGAFLMIGSISKVPEATPPPPSAPVPPTYPETPLNNGDTNIKAPVDNSGERIDHEQWTDVESNRPAPAPPNL